MARKYISLLKFTMFLWPARQDVMFSSMFFYHISEQSEISYRYPLLQILTIIISKVIKKLGENIQLKNIPFRTYARYWRGIVVEKAIWQADVFYQNNTFRYIIIKQYVFVIELTNNNISSWIHISRGSSDLTSYIQLAQLILD